MTNAFSVHIGLHMHSNAAAVLGGIASKLGLLNSQVNGAGAGLSNLGKGLAVAGAGMVALWAGGAILGGLNKTINAQSHYLEQINQMKLKGWELKEIQEAEAAARITSARVLGTTWAQNLRVYQELTAAMPDMKEVGHILPQVQAMAMNIQVGRTAAGMNTTAEQAQDQSYDIVKAIELSKYAKDPAAYGRIMDKFFQAMSYFSYKVDARDFHQAMKMTRDAGGSLSEHFMTRALPVLIQEFKTGRAGAGGAGQAIAAFSQTVVSGQMKEASAAEFVRLGLVSEDSIVRAKNGTVKGIRPRGMTAWQLAQSDPDKWLNQFVLPAMIANGITDPAAQRAELAVLFQNRLARQGASLMTMQRWKFLRDEKGMDRALPITAAQQRLIRTSPEAAKVAVAAQKENIAASIGKEWAPIKAAVMAELAIGLNKIATALEAHPEVTKWMVRIAVGLGALLIVFGIVAVIAGVVMTIMAIISGVALAPVLIIGAVIAGIIAFVVMLYSFNWAKIGKAIGDAIKGLITGVAKAIAGFVIAYVKWHVGVYKAVYNFFVGCYNAFIKAAPALFDKLIAWFKALPGRIAGFATGGSTQPQQPRQSWGGYADGKIGPVPSSARPPPSGSHRLLVVKTSVNLDGRQIATAVNNVNSRDMGRQQTGPTGYNQAEGYVPGVQRA